MKAFRVSKEQFGVGAEIPIGHRLENLPADRLEVESVLESMRPSEKPRRTDARYVFKEHHSALAWAIDAVDRKVYEVEVEKVLHEGDWNWIGRIWKESDAGIRKQMAAKYWKSEFSDQPTVELIVSKATVLKQDMKMSRADQIKQACVKYGLPDPTESIRSTSPRAGKSSTTCPP